MKWKIMHESKGRIRVHAQRGKFDLMQADALQLFLESEEYIQKATVFEKTGAVIILYRRGCRKKVLETLAGFRFSSALSDRSTWEGSGRKLNREYFDKLIMLIFGKIARDLFMPMPVRIAYILLKAIPFILRGCRTLLTGKLRVELLDALSIFISLLRADFATVSSVTFLLRIGELLEEWTHKKSVDDLARSMALHVDTVWVVTDGHDVQMPISRVKAGDLIRVQSGSIIPVDAVVDRGEAMVNQASLTGESVPVVKKSGSSVYAGTIVEEGNLVIRTKKEAGQGRYDQIVKMIEESEKLKSGTAARFDDIADRLVPFSFLGMGLTYLLTGNVTRAISVIMVDFSCALKLAMPITVLSGMREAGGYKITVKGGKFLENIAQADTMVFDKTGTLTYAAPKVAKVVACAGEDAEEMLRIAACLEEHFPHSMANAVVNKAAELGLTHDEMHTKVDYIVAHGISSSIDVQYLKEHKSSSVQTVGKDGKESLKVIIGSRHFIFEDEKTIIAKEDQGILDTLEAEYSHLYLAIGGKLSAILCIHDPLRKEARDVLLRLKKLGITRTVMMTGDNEKTARAIAAEVGVDEYHAEVLPEDKAGFIEKEKKLGRRVIMVGDGINDSPALSAADCGIAMAQGAAIAREIADVTICGDSLEELVLLRMLADALMERIHRNYRFIIGFNGSLIILGVLGLIMPTASALLHNASTLGIGLLSMTDLLEKERIAHENEKRI